MRERWRLDKSKEASFLLTYLHGLHGVVEHVCVEDELDEVLSWLVQLGGEHSWRGHWTTIGLLNSFKLLDQLILTIQR